MANSLKEAFDQADNEAAKSIVIKLTDEATLIRLKPGDILAIKVPETIEPKIAGQMADVLKSRLPAGTYFFFHKDDDMKFRTVPMEAGD